MRVTTVVLATVLGFGLLGARWADPVSAAPRPLTAPPVTVAPVPMVGVTPPTTPVGSTVRANLNGWHVPLVLVTVCGDLAHRGSEDCDQVGTHGVLISASGEGSALLAVTPPIGCPCVIRASTPDNQVVRTAPITVVGAPTLTPAQLAPDLDREAVAASSAPTASANHNNAWLALVATLVGIGAILAVVYRVAFRRRTPAGATPGGPTPAGATPSPTPGDPTPAGATPSPTPGDPTPPDALVEPPSGART